MRAVGSLLSGIGAYLSVWFLSRYFKHRSLRPFGVYCIVDGLFCPCSVMPSTEFIRARRFSNAIWYVSSTTPSRPKRRSRS